MLKADAELRRVRYVNLPAQYAEERSDILRIVDEVFRRGDFIGGASIEILEHELAQFLGVHHVVALNSGTDALILGLKSLGIGPGDEVITPANSFIASTAAIVAVGAIPVFADVLPDQNIAPDAIAAAITARTKAIMPVHLTGRVADMHAIMRLAHAHGLAVIEDSAQAVGSKYDGKMAGSFGTVGCYSAHPLKNLNAAGDAGFVATNDAEIAARIKRLRNHGLVDRNKADEWGTVSRLDTLQAEILRLRLRNLPSVIDRRRAIATQYRRELEGCPVFCPPCRNEEFNTFHTFVVQTDRRDEMKAFLLARGIETAIHYPLPIHLQPAAKGLGYKKGSLPQTERQAERILTLPANQFLSADDVSYVAANISEFCNAN